MYDALALTWARNNCNTIKKFNYLRIQARNSLVFYSKWRNMVRTKHNLIYLINWEVINQLFYDYFVCIYIIGYALRFRYKIEVLYRTVASNYVC